MKKNYYLGLDVGGSKIEGAIAIINNKDQKIEVMAQKRVPCVHDVEAFLNSLTQLIQDLLKNSQLDFDDIKGIGIGLPGTLDPKTKIMLNGNTQFLIGVDVLNLLQKRLKQKVNIVLQNDANLFTLAEAWGGAGLLFEKNKGVAFKEQVALGITLGTGVGGGLVVLGKILNGAQGSALEVGHISLSLEGGVCYCGQRGCAETYLSGTALNKFMDSQELFKNVESDAEKMTILRDYRGHMVHFLSILNNLFNPHYFVFGGGLSSQTMLLHNLKSALSAKTFLPKEYSPEIYLNQLGESSGLFGAMIYAHEKTET